MLKIYSPNQFLLIAGPCSLETDKVCHEVAETLIQVQETHPEITLIFKGSFDKANRTSLKSMRGPGIEEGLKLLKEVKKAYKLPVLTDVHLPDHCQMAAEVCDILQIPAFLCRQTDLLVAAAKTGKVVNVKKGQFLSPQEMAFVVEKLIYSDAHEIWQTERGTLFGYQNLVVDMRAFSIMKKFQNPVIFDATHSVQLSGAAEGESGGFREYVLPLAKAALAAGADGLFIETHPNPDNAYSDRACQIPLKHFSTLVEKCLAIWHANS